MENNNEDRLQAKIVTWFNNTYCLKHHNPRYLIFSVPNGGNRNKKEAMLFKATGLLSGVSDLIVVMPNKVLFVELKTESGTQSASQIEFQLRVSELGFNYYIVRSLDEFKKLTQ
jgi:hypothetical protein